MLTASDKANKFKHTQNLGQQPKVSKTVAGCFPTRVGLIIIIIIVITHRDLFTVSTVNSRIATLYLILLYCLQLPY